MTSTAKTNKARPRTYARNRATSVSRRRSFYVESDSTYFLKLVIVVVLGTLWIKLGQPVSWNSIPFGGFPLGAVIGIVAIKLLEKNHYNRKIWYAVLVVITILSYFVPAGIII